MVSLCQVVKCFVITPKTRMEQSGEEIMQLLVTTTYLGKITRKFISLSKQ